YKAAFESFITVQDESESAKLQKFGGELQDIENHLPIDPALRNPKLGALAPIVVVNEIFAAGDGNRGVQTAAFNLPNDERVIREKGSERVMLTDVHDAQLEKSLERPLYTTFLASTFRSIRFGVNEAHGKGIAVQLNYLIDQGAVTVKPSGTFAVNPAKIKDGVTGLTREIMTIQAEGSYAKAKA